MNRGKMFLTPEDLQKMMGTYNLRSAYNHHKAIREAIAPGKKSLTIREYCEYTSSDFTEIYFEIRGEKPPLPFGENDTMK